MVVLHPMDTLSLEGFICKGVHGVHPHEWQQPQEFEVAVYAEFDASLAAHTDALDDTVCWTRLEQIAKDIIENGPKLQLIETMATRIAEQILREELRIEAVAVTVKKREVRVQGVPGITIRKSRL